MKTSILACVDCFAGADMKNEYLGKDQIAWVWVVDVGRGEALPEMMLKELDVKEFVEGQKLTKKEIADISDAIVRIRVSAIKP